jgi:hypothetical protein
MTKRSEQRLPGIERPVSHLVFSDGVASVSVFIQNAADGQSGTLLTGASQIGSSAAYSTRIDGHLVTAVGEVPAGTVRMIATTVRPQAAPAGPSGPVQAERALPQPGSASPPDRPADAGAPRGPESLRRPAAVPALAPTEPRR